MFQMELIAVLAELDIVVFHGQLDDSYSFVLAYDFGNCGFFVFEFFVYGEKVRHFLKNMGGKFRNVVELIVPKCRGTDCIAGH